VSVFIAHLEMKGAVAGIVPAADPSRPGDRWAAMLSGYLWFLEHHRGFSPSTTQARVRWARVLFDHLNGKISSKGLDTITIEMIDEFVLTRAASMSRGYQHQLIESVRCVLRYLRQERYIRYDLASQLSSPRRYVDATVPPILTPEEIERVVAAVDCRAPTGLRDRAVLVLLAVYGVRSGEIVALRIDDVDWELDRLRIMQRKNRRELVLPLVPEVGEAILTYLRNGRPETDHREVFVGHKAPHAPMGTTAVYLTVRKAIKRAGIRPPQLGPRLFRHAKATMWVRSGWSLKAVGDLLGHRTADATRVYSKLAVEDLRTVALDLPEAF
jgi:site-specific recombinase XerD